MSRGQWTSSRPHVDPDSALDHPHHNLSQIRPRLDTTPSSDWPLTEELPVNLILATVRGRWGGQAECRTIGRSDGRAIGRCQAVGRTVRRTIRRSDGRNGPAVGEALALTVDRTCRRCGRTAGRAGGGAAAASADIIGPIRRRSRAAHVPTTGPTTCLSKLYHIWPTAAECDPFF